MCFNYFCEKNVSRKKNTQNFPLFHFPVSTFQFSTFPLFHFPVFPVCRFPLCQLSRFRFSNSPTHVSVYPFTRLKIAQNTPPNPLPINSSFRYPHPHFPATRTKGDRNKLAGLLQISRSEDCNREGAQHEGQERV